MASQQTPQWPYPFPTFSSPSNTCSAQIHKSQTRCLPLPHLIHQQVLSFYLQTHPKSDLFFPSPLSSPSPCLQCLVPGGDVMIL